MCIELLKRLLLALVMVLLPANAMAAFHLMKVVEVFPGTPATPGAQYVVLQMYAANQRIVTGHKITVYDATGALTDTFTFAGPVAIGTTQSKILIATADAVSLFNVAADMIMTPVLNPAGGKVCFDGGGLDCIAWGNYSGPSNATVGLIGTPFNVASGLPLGQAAARRLDISGSPTLLEAADDTNDCANDFVLAAPAPKNNAGVVGVLPTATSTVLASTPNPSGFGAAVMLTATVTATGGSVPTGSVTFEDGGVGIGTVALVGLAASAEAQLNLSSLAGGTHNLTARYVGNASFETSTSAALSQIVDPAATTTVLGADINPSVFGQPITLTAAVAAVDPGVGPVASGTVTFKQGVLSLGAGAVAGGSATLAIATLVVGNNNLTAVYGGNTDFVGSTSPGIVQTVQKGATATALTANPSPSKTGQSVTFSATVTATPPASGTPTGSVTFKRGAAVLGTRALSSGVATLDIATLAVATHSITAIYGGSASFDTATSPVLLHAVQKGATTTTLVAAPNPGHPGELVTFTAAVQATAPAVGVPAGMVNFKKGTTVLGMGILSAAGVATFSTAALTTGNHAVTASYVVSNKFLASTSSAVDQLVDPRFGPEFRVNTVTAGAQRWPAIGTSSSGGVVVVWQSFGQDGSSDGIYGQRYDAAGVASGAEFRVNTRTANSQALPAVAALDADKFVVVWQSTNQDGSSIGIYGQRYTAAGVKDGAEFRVNTTTANAQSRPAVAALTDGGFVVAWQSAAQDGSGTGIYAQRYQASGAVLGTEFQVNTTAASDQSDPAIAMLTAGGFVVAWRSLDQDGASGGIYAQRYSVSPSTTMPDGVEVQVNTATADDQSNPAVAGLPGGGSVVTWTSALQDGSGLGVYGRRFASDGTPLGGEFRVNTRTISNQWQSAVAAFPDGGFIVGWSSFNQDGSRHGVYAQRYDATGAPIDVEFRLNTTTLQDQWEPAIAVQSAASFTAVWTSRDQDTSLEGVYGQRFEVVPSAAPRPAAVAR